MERIFLYLIFGVIFGFLVAFLWEKLAVSILKIEHLAHRKGYHFHHSFIAPCALLFIPFISDPKKTFFLVGFAVGVIIQHTISDGFVFITKD